MDRPTRRPAFVRFLAPGALLLGVAVGFLTCCLLGRLVSQRNIYRHFVRFHGYLTPETLYYPTPCQLGALGRSRLDPDRIAVVVGGSSRMHGTGQTAEQVWTRKLQEQLGDRYRVINFGFRRASTCEVGLAAAEALSREHPRLIFVTDCNPCWIEPSPDGSPFRYFFWSAYYKGMLLPDAKRLAQLEKVAARERNLEREQGRVGQYDDLKRRAWLDSL